MNVRACCWKPARAIALCKMESKNTLERGMSMVGDQLQDLSAGSTEAQIAVGTLHLRGFES